MSIEYKVSIWEIEYRSDRKRKPYRLRWVVSKKIFVESFTTYAMADSFRSDLKSALNRGEAFDSRTGLPVSMRATADTDSDSRVTCYKAFIDYVEHKRKKSAKYRRDIADVLRDVMCLLLPDSPDKPDEAVLREALRRFAFNVTSKSEVSVDIADALDWAEQFSPVLTELEDMRTLRRVLDGLTIKLDGQLASPKYFAKRRRTLYNVLKWAVAEEHLDANPLESPKLKWEQDEALKISDVIDPREVGNMRQIEDMLTAVSYVGTAQGPRLVAFFGVLYYAMARPEEAIELREDQCELPSIADDATESDINEWGVLYLETASPDVGLDWTFDGSVHEVRGLKQRGRGAIRAVPIPPRLVWLLYIHISLFGVASDGRLFRSLGRSRRGTTANRVGSSTYNTVWKKAREFALPPRERRSTLLRRPYSCRHSGISKRRYAGVPAQQVAEWAGHSAAVQDQVYAKVLEGYDDRWRRQIDAFMIQEEAGT